MNPANPLIIPSANTELDSSSRKQPKAQTEPAETPFKETLEKQSSVSKVEPKDRGARPEKEESTTLSQEKPVRSKETGVAENSSLPEDAEDEAAMQVSADFAYAVEQSSDLVLQEEGVVTDVLTELAMSEASVDVDADAQPLLVAQPSQKGTSDLSAEGVLVSDAVRVSELIDTEQEGVIHHGQSLGQVLSTGDRTTPLKTKVLTPLGDSVARVLSTEGQTRPLSVGPVEITAESKPTLASSLQGESSLLNGQNSGAKMLSSTINTEQGLLLNSGKQSLVVGESGLAALESLDTARVDKALLSHAKAGGVSAVVTTPQLVSSVEGRVSMPVNITFGEAGWAGQVAERSAMIASQNIRFAELQLDPPELGPLQVKVTVNQDQASVSFVATNLQVKDALDQTIPKLRELLDEQGLNLANVDVSDQSSSEADEDTEEGDSQQLATAEEEDQFAEAGHQYTAEYGVDFYA